MNLVRVARQADVGEGQKIVKECHGRNLLLARSRGTVFCTDAACFHMGGPLVEGDIEDVGGRTCVVCPWHRYRIDMETGCKVDTDLCGNVCGSGDQKQRTYRVTGDAEFIWVDIPDLPVRRLESDTYNAVQQQQQQPPVRRQNFGLSGVSTTTAGPSSQPSAPPTPLEPYAGVVQRPMVHSPSDGMEGQLQFSQEAMSPGPPLQSGPSPMPPHRMGQARVDAPHIARRKAATAAIAAKAYKPPTVSVTAAAAAPTPLTTQKSAQKTLFDLAWGLQRGAATTAAGDDMMDMS